MGKVMVIDIGKCNGCYNCQVACKDEHVDNDWTPIAKPQPDTGHFWMKVTDIVQGTVPKVRVRYMLDTCQHCDLQA
jgi:tetrathionate reductase subunit B